MIYMRRELDQSADKAALALPGAWLSILRLGSLNAAVQGDSRALSTKEPFKLAQPLYHALADARPLQTCRWLSPPQLEPAPCHFKSASISAQCTKLPCSLSVYLDAPASADLPGLS